MENGGWQFESGEKQMTVLKNWKTKLFVILVVALAVSAVLGYRQFSQKEIMKQELNLNGLFVNIKGVETKTTSSDFFSDKPYDTIVIKIPSIASTGDDATTEKDAKDVNQIIDREKLDKGFIAWLKSVFDDNVAKHYANHIEVWYRDDKIINKNFK
jgi:hypothetical protein